MNVRTFHKIVAELKYEAGTLFYILHPATRANPMNLTEYVATMLLFATWSALMIGISFGLAEKPPFFNVFTGIVLVIFGRIWGINLAHRAVGISAHPSREHYEGKKDETANRGEDANGE